MRKPIEVQIDTISLSKFDGQTLEEALITLQAIFEEVPLNFTNVHLKTDYDGNYEASYESLRLWGTREETQREEFRRELQEKEAAVAKVRAADAERELYKRLKAKYEIGET